MLGRLAAQKYGVPEYCSPETVNGEGVSLSTDMWSLGIVTYILLSGISPFRGNNDMETLDYIKAGTINIYMIIFILWSFCLSINKSNPVSLSI